MQSQNKFVENSQSFKFAPPPLQLNSAVVYVLQYSSSWNHKAKSYGIKTTSYGIKTTSYGIKTRSYAHMQNYKLRPQNNKLRVQNLQVWQLKLISYNFLKRCFECTFNSSLQMVVFRGHSRARFLGR